MVNNYNVNINNSGHSIVPCGILDDTCTLGVRGSFGWRNLLSTAYLSFGERPILPSIEELADPQRVELYFRSIL